MPKLNCTKKVVFECDYSDFEALIKEVYNQDYEILPMEEVGSSQYSASWDFSVSNGKMDDFDLEELQTLLDGEPNQFMFHIITKDLCNEGHIEEGDYIMGISW